MTTADTTTERDLSAELKRRRKVLADVERELADIRANLPVLIEEHGQRLEALKAQETVVFHELQAAQEPGQLAPYIDPYFRRERPSADVALNQHEKLTSHAAELGREIDSLSKRAYALECNEVPQLRGWVQEAADLLSTYQTQIAEAVAREERGEKPPPLTFDQVRRRIMGGV